MKLFDEKRSGNVRDAVAALVEAWPGVEAKAMMGCPGWRANGALFASVIDQGVMLHTLSPSDRAEALASLGAQPFRPRPGREMATWPVVPATAASVAALEPWLENCYENALAKAKTKTKAKKPQARAKPAAKASATATKPAPTRAGARAGARGKKPKSARRA